MRYLWDSRLPEPLRGIIRLAVLLLLVSPVFATDIYFGPTSAGSNNGSSCANAYAYNDPTHGWSLSAQQVAGNNLHICPGTYPGSTNGTLLTFVNSGSSGHPITLVADQGTAIFTSPYWNSPNGAINVNGQSYITINGNGSTPCGWSAATQKDTACNLEIVNTANGTSLANQASSVGISIPSNSTYDTVENVDIHNIYQRSGSGTEDSTNYTSQNCILLGYTGSGVQNITLQNGFCYMAGWGIQSGGPGPITISGWELYDEDHNVSNAAQTLYLFGNHFHDWGIWDTTTDAYHHDGFHCYAGSAGASNLIYIYNNQFDGSTTQGGGAGGMNAYVFLEGEDGTACFTANATALYFFNNVGAGSGTWSGYTYLSGYGSGNTSTNLGSMLLANNTMIGNYPTDTGASGACLAFDFSNDVTIENNACGGFAPLIAQKSNYNTYTANPDYNFWEDCGGGAGCFQANGVSSASFATWQAGGNDAHGGANLSSTTYFGLNSNCTAGSVGQNCAPQSGSPLIAAGKNLYSVCSGQSNPGLGALCYDITGAARPTSGAWDAGAFNAGTSYTLTTTLVGTGSVSSSPSGISCPSTCSASYSSGTVVTLTATAGTGYTFTGWTGAGCSGTGTCAVTMSAAESVTATFAANTAAPGSVVISGGVVVNGGTVSK